MDSVYIDAASTDDDRRRRLFDGQLFVFGARPSVLALTRFAREMIEDAFRGKDPELAQYSMPVEEYAKVLGDLKPKFIHHAESKRHLQNILQEFGCDAENTYFEVPKLRSSTSDNYLTAGIAYAWHPHRDIWYSAPLCQVNWWLPVFDLTSDNAMAFHPRYWSKPIKNSSAGYNYYVWNAKYRGEHIKSFTTKDPRPLPAPTEEVEMTPQLRLICPVGGVIIFSGAQLHSSVPNTSGRTRFSIDFRTVHAGDLAARIGAPNIDSACTGTVLHEFKAAADLSPLPREILAMYEDGSETEGGLVYAAPDKR